MSEQIIVVGSGIVGLACAHYLTEAGCRVTVIDKGRVAAACSHGNCGYVCPSHIPPLTEPSAIPLALKSLFQSRSPFRVKPTLNPAVLRWMWEFAKRCTHRQVLTAGKHLQAILDASMAEYRQLMATQGLACEWQEKGLLYVFRGEQAFDAFAETDRMIADHFGVAAQRLTGAELAKMEPGLREGLYGAFHYPGDASLRPDLLNQRWAERLRERGVTFREQCELQGVRREGGKVVALTTAAGELTADRYVFALGSWSTLWSRELGCSIPIQPGKGYSVTMARPENSPSHPMLFPEHKVGVSPFENGFRLGSMMEFVGYDESIPAFRIQQLRDAARPFLVASVDGEAQETWYGWRPMTWDSLPIIGPIPRVANAYLATGHNMLGLSLAPSTGRLIAELITGRPPHIPLAPYSVDRFPP